MKNDAKKAVPKAMGEKAKEGFTGLKHCQDKMFRVIKR